MQDKTGTWNGPAPTGFLNSGAAAEPARPAVVREPATTVLSSGQQMPMIGLGTYKLESADVVKKALELGYRHFDCKFHRTVHGLDAYMFVGHIICTAVAVHPDSKVQTVQHKDSSVHVGRRRV